ncbi:MAG: hypothetical protein ABL962_08995 [Fimbriimonadaceae bacterium]
MKVYTFRALLTASWVLGIVSLALSYVLEPTLPQALRDFLAADNTSSDGPEFGVVEIGQLVLMILFLVVIVANYIGLYLWRNWARWSFCAVYVVAFLSSLLLNQPTIEPALVSEVGSLVSIIDGVLIASMFSVEPIRSKFVQEPEDPPPPL